ncbi:MAG TPA: peptidoglycan editing factor PgeF [Candidatus Pseudogracilibacillus intestinigallinarum]|uniref:Purine nucleoside phosphorylase n=1 Tax=Candidatus Pseudogracilibacillus intestinigallinarum TaxID=2838742 RepID=A0A9D1PL71_9BACI|nr:peptidoglycan editing factor PgeF [Candidatus Pseudogracilibacillus intestinigallinarum]
MKIFIKNDQILACMTMKDETKLEANNMALHSCKNEANIIENRKRIAAEIGASIDDFVFPTQTHSANFYKVTEADKGRGATTLDDAIANTDALYTFEPDIVLCSFSADCVPILFYHETANVIGVIHSGWRGTIQEIAKKFFQHLIEQENCSVKGFRIVIGPAICKEKFEVDEDVASLFRELGYAKECIHFNQEKNKFFIDNQQTIIQQLQLIGIKQHQIMIDDTCTFQHEAGFSHRRDKEKGRHMAFIRRSKSCQ